MAFYGLFSWLDFAIYSLVKYIVRLIILVANYDFFSEGTINELADRVYIILGVLVLFKIVISAIQYMVNPDTFDDKEKGMAGILKKTLICMALLAVIRPIFMFAIKIQQTVVATVPALVLGTEAENFSIKSPDAMTQLDEIGDLVAGTTIRTFVTMKDATKTDPMKDNVPEGKQLEAFSTNILNGCDKGIGSGKYFKADQCDYNYQWGISTAAGVFLLYVLLSMALDVGIRTIKLGIIQILAPIPISSYMVSKDKFNKFVKTSVKIYLDLFIRLIVIYFIIFFVNKVIINIGNSVDINGYPASGTDALFVKVIIICALFMFAKNAPKFICNLLGLDAGSGDFADMFKPAWQRAGGAAGAFINPARNAISNVRDAWKNNADMVDSRGGKLRRALQKTRRVGNAARHGLGGAMRGAVDAFAGAAAGDNWQKMNERHRKAIANSKRRTAEGFMKRTDNDVRQEYKDKRKEIEKEFAKQGIDINAINKRARKAAEKKVDGLISGSKAKIDYINRRLASGAGTLEERRALTAELAAETQRLNELSSPSGREEYIKTEMANAKASMIQEVIDSKVASNKEKQRENRERMMILESELNDPSLQLSDSERSKKAAEYTRLMNENEEIEESNTTAGQEKMREALSKEYDEQVKIKTEGLDKERDISSWTITKGKVDQFFGGEGFTGKGYLDTADLLKNNRSSLYTGEAMTKMRQNADILVDANGNEATFEVSFTNKKDANGNPIKLSYSYLADLKRRVDAGDPSVNLKDEGFENSAMLQSAFEDMEKKAAEAYVTANMAADDPSINSKFKLKRGGANTTIVEGIKRMKASIASSNIPKEEKDALLKELSENPGAFFKKASDLQERMRTKGSRISAYNSGKKEG